MKSRLVTTFCLALLLGLICLPASAQQTKIATIDLRKVFDNYHKTKTATEALKQRGNDLDKENSALTAEFRKAQEEYKKMLEDANNMAVSADEREKRKKAAESKLRDLQDIEQKIQQFRATATTTMEEQERRMRENIVGEIRAVVSAKAKGAGYTLVLDIAGESRSLIPVVIYSNGENDITDAILAQLNATAPKK